MHLMAQVLSDPILRLVQVTLPGPGLNAPYGARYFLTAPDRLGCVGHGMGLNAPYGAR